MNHQICEKITKHCDFCIDSWGLSPIVIAFIFKDVSQKSCNVQKLKQRCEEFFIGLEQGNY